jgi:hypothetical protein
MVECRKSARTGKTTGFRGRYVGPDTAKHSLTFSAKVDAEAWLSREESLIARGEWTPPRWRTVAVTITVDKYAEQNLALRRLSPRSREERDRHRERFITDTPIGRAGMRSVTSLDVAAWLAGVRASTDRLLRNLLRRDVDAANGTVNVRSQVQNLRGQGKGRSRREDGRSSTCGGPTACSDLLAQRAARRWRTARPRWSRVSIDRGDADLSQSTFWEA